MGVQWDCGEPGDEVASRRQILAFLEEYCERGMTLREACEWYADAFALDPVGSAEDRRPALNLS